MTWKVNGEVILSCNCEVFCPCVASLGGARPSEGYCHSWWGIKIDKGEYGGETLDGLLVGILLDVPGRMGEGDWKVALFIDERASDAAFEKLGELFTGKGGGSLGVLAFLIGEVVGMERAALDFSQTANGWKMTAKQSAKKIADCAIEKVAGADGKSSVMVCNSQYWVAPDVTVCEGAKSRVRAFGRVWNFDGLSAEHAVVSWSGE